MDSKFDTGSISADGFRMMFEQHYLFADTTGEMKGKDGYIPVNTESFDRYINNWDLLIEKVNRSSDCRLEYREGKLLGKMLYYNSPGGTVGTCIR